jgi:hypothetical protein
MSTRGRCRALVAEYLVRGTAAGGVLDLAATRGLDIGGVFLTNDR